ncbi:MAG TPA: carbohydrate-binding family 9-like protein [Vicinamibacteria bacterium]|nr:carbohydrate-binding family 9-like protein [Vicinamibacteria bacterium]
MILLALVLSVAQAGYMVERATADREALLAGAPEAWKGAVRVRWGPSPYETDFAALWEPDALYLRFDARDPSPWSTMTRRDDHLWEEEVVEIFLDPDRSGRNYAELEISPANVVCDVRMVSPSPHKEMDLAWNLEGLETRVVPLRDGGAAEAVGWTALARLPWTAFRSLPSAARIALPPRSGDRWRFNLFRIERPGGKEHPEKGAVEVAWSPTGQPSFHVPAAFRDLVFAKEKRPR